MSKTIKKTSFEMLDAGNVRIDSIKKSTGYGGSFGADSYASIHLTDFESDFSALKNPRVVAVIAEDADNAGNYYMNPGWIKATKSGSSYTLYLYLLKSFGGMTFGSDYSVYVELIVASDPE